ncbi:MAG: hypothetical protein M0D55_16395 [Elusimicrobiota bacterium]|nr:MAG: hypothetical protein M0D55_16395 [Elusimicrobiota bacterium]
MVAALESEDQQLVAANIISIGRTRDRRSVKHVMRFLMKNGDEELRRPPNPATMPHRDTAYQALTYMLPSIFKDIKAEAGRTKEDPMDVWKNWWRKHGNEYGR